MASGAVIEMRETMETLIVEVELPRDLLAALNIPASEAGHRAKEWVAIELFREGEISAGKAAEILGMTKMQFIALLDKRGVSYLDLDPGELASDFASAVDASNQSEHN